MNAIELFQRVLLCVCLTALGISALLLAAYWIARTSSPMLAWIRKHGLDALLVAPFVIGLVYVGSTKTGSVTYPYTDPEKRYLTDAGSYVTNDYVHVAFVRSVIVPASANFFGAVRSAESTNDADWVEFLATTFSDFANPTNLPYAGALTNSFAFYTDYTPGPAVHTNGVAIVNWQKAMSGSTSNIVPWRTVFYIEGQRVAPSASITNGPPVSQSLTTTGGNENE